MCTCSVKKKEGGKEETPSPGHRISPSTAIGISTAAPTDNGKEEPESDDDTPAGAGEAATATLGSSGPPPLSRLVSEKVTFSESMPAINEDGTTSGTLQPSTWSSMSTVNASAVKASGTSSAPASTSGTGTAANNEPHLALYNFSSLEAGDMSFVAGDIIYVTRKNDVPGWYIGTHSTRTGAGSSGSFPANYVEPTSANGAANGSGGGSGNGAQQLTTIDKHLIVTADRAPSAENEMDVKKGDRVHVTTSDGLGWYYGTNTTRGDAGGWLPSEICKEPPAAGPAPAKPVPGPKPVIASSTLKAAATGTTAAPAPAANKFGTLNASATNANAGANKFGTAPAGSIKPVAPGTATAAGGAVKRPPLPALPPTPGTAPKPTGSTPPPTGTATTAGTAPTRPVLPNNKPAVSGGAATTTTGGAARPPLPAAPNANASTAPAPGAGGVKALAAKWK